MDGKCRGPLSRRGLRRDWLIQLVHRTELLSGIASICTSMIAAFGRAIRPEHFRPDAHLKKSPGTSNVGS
jgi:hypothetical protein